MDTGFDKGVVTHVRSFNEYVDDLERFVSKEVAPRVRATRVQGNTSPQSDKIVYVANSVAGEHVWMDLTKACRWPCHIVGLQMLVNHSALRIWWSTAILHLLHISSLSTSSTAFCMYRSFDRADVASAVSGIRSPGPGDPLHQAPWTATACQGCYQVHPTFLTSCKGSSSYNVTKLPSKSSGEMKVNGVKVFYPI